MEVDEFLTAVEDARSNHPIWFELDSDPPASREHIRAAEEALGVEFPSAYREFLLRMGGGYFAFVSIASVEPTSEWNIVRLNERVGLFKEGFLAISENGVGDYYGFTVDEGQCSDRVTLADHEQDYAVRDTQFTDVFEFLVETGLQPR